MCWKGSCLRRHIHQCCRSVHITALGCVCVHHRWAQDPGSCSPWQMLLAWQSSRNSSTQRMMVAASNWLSLPSWACTAEALQGYDQGVCEANQRLWLSLNALSTIALTPTVEGLLPTQLYQMLLFLVVCVTAAATVMRTTRAACTVSAVTEQHVWRFTTGSKLADVCGTPCLPPPPPPHITHTICRKALVAVSHACAALCTLPTGVLKVHLHRR